MSPESEPDYITVNASVTDGLFNVVIMRWDNVQDSFYAYRCSPPMRQESAEMLARSWARAMHLEVR